MTLYLKYRPQKVSELDLVSVRNTLEKILSSKNIPHAFLFAGPKGTGKTSSARILAKTLNCTQLVQSLEPCGECDQCKSIAKGTNIDVVEMDAASNRGIDDIRILRENIKLAPARAKYKIYIIDEAHMLTTEAANALLKTLEEPPAHVVFVLATTNPEKLPQTINSRLTVVNFNKATDVEIVTKLQNIAKEEKIDFEADTFELIAKASDGSFRDAVKNLEMLVMQNSKLTVELVREVLYQTNIANPGNLAKFLDLNQIDQAIAEVEKISTQGANIKLFMDQLISLYHQRLISAIQSNHDTSETSKFLKLLSKAKQEVSISPVVQLPLELAILKYKKKADSAPVKKTLEIAKNSNPPQKWDEVLVQMRNKNASIEALLRASKPISFDGKTLTLGVYYKFHKERLEAGTNRITLENTLALVYGDSIRVDCVLTEKPAALKKEAILEEPNRDLASVAKEIFGA